MGKKKSSYRDVLRDLGVTFGWYSRWNVTRWPGPTRIRLRERKYGSASNLISAEKTTAAALFFFRLSMNDNQNDGFIHLEYTTPVRYIALTDTIATCTLCTLFTILFGHPTFALL